MLVKLRMNLKLYLDNPFLCVFWFHLLYKSALTFKYSDKTWTFM